MSPPQTSAGHDKVLELLARPEIASRMSIYRELAA
jgi:hypothetical protein